MSNHGSGATVREATPHVKQISTQTVINQTNEDDSTEKIEALAAARALRSEDHPSKGYVDALVMYK